MVKGLKMVEPDSYTTPSPMSSPWDGPPPPLCLMLCILAALHQTPEIHFSHLPGNLLGIVLIKQQPLLLPSGAQAGVSLGRLSIQDSVPLPKRVKCEQFHFKALDFHSPSRNTPPFPLQGLPSSLLPLPVRELPPGTPNPLNPPAHVWIPSGQEHWQFASTLRASVFLPVIPVLLMRITLKICNHSNARALAPGIPIQWIWGTLRYPTARGSTSSHLQPSTWKAGGKAGLPPYQPLRWRPWWC